VQPEDPAHRSGQRLEAAGGDHHAVARAQMIAQPIEHDRYLVGLRRVPGGELVDHGLEPLRRHADRGQPDDRSQGVTSDDRKEERNSQHRREHERRSGAVPVAQDQPADEPGRAVAAQQRSIEVEHRDRALGGRRAHH